MSGNHDGLEEEHHEAGVDLFLTFEVGNFRFLGEYLLSTEEQMMERFQLGWVAGDTLFWLGRFHNPVGYWNTRYHHGAYLQTGISRPAIAKFEEHDGILPMHQAGLLIDGMFGSNELGLGYSLALAKGPEFTGVLEPWDVLDPSEREHDTSLTLNFYREIETGRFGVFTNYTRIPSSVATIDEIKQWVLGGYMDLEFDRWSVHGSVFHVENELLRPTGPDKNSFLNAYLQGEYEISEKFRLFGRIEGTADAKDDAYLELFPDFVKDSLVGGIRFDFVRRNALKLEFSGNRTVHENFTQLMLQWSAQF